MDTVAHLSPGRGPREAEARVAIDLGACFRAHADWLRRALLPRAGSWQCAEDIVQETFCHAVEQGLGLYEGPGLRAWLYRVAVHKSMHRARAGARRAGALARLLGEPRSPAIEPQAWLADRQQAAQVHRLLAELTEERRQVLVLHGLHDLAVDEIAARLGIPVGTVGSRLARGRCELRGAWLAAHGRAR